jgi:hypothetical protein
MRLIDADALIPMMRYTTTDNEIGVFPIKIGFDAIKRVIDEAPTIDAVSKGVLEQFRWERDVAMEQLEEYGIPFCTNKDKDIVKVVRCKNCRWYQKGKNEVDSWQWCMVKHCDVSDDAYCSYGWQEGGEEE